MIVAGKLSLECIMDKNIFYYVSSKQGEHSKSIFHYIFCYKTKEETELIGQYFKSNECNNHYNMIRNNLISASFKCIRNAMICLFVVFIILIISKLFAPLNPEPSNLFNFKLLILN